MHTDDDDRGEGNRERELIQRRLASCLVVLFAVVVVYSLAAVGFGQDPGALTAILQLVLPSIVALTAIVLRFYFSERPDRRRTVARDTHRQERP
jgi:hypothetical protein